MQDFNGLFHMGLYFKSKIVNSSKMLYINYIFEKLRKKIYNVLICIVLPFNYVVQYVKLKIIPMIIYAIWIKLQL